MPWTPKYEARFEESLVNNILDIFTRDFKDALDYFYPTEAAYDSTDPRYLKDFAEKALGQVLGNETPMLAIGPVRNAASPSDDDSHMIQAVRIDLALGVTDDGPDTVTRRIMRYTRTAVAVLHSANKSDFFANMSSQGVFGLVLETEQVYRSLRANDSVYFRDSTVEVTLQIRER